MHINLGSLAYLSYFYSSQVFSKYNLVQEFSNSVNKPI